MKFVAFLRIAVVTACLFSFPAYYGWTVASAGSGNSQEETHEKFIPLQAKVKSFVSLCADAGLGGPDGFSQGQFNDINCPPVESYKFITPIDGFIDDDVSSHLDVVSGPYQSSCATAQADGKVRSHSALTLPADGPPSSNARIRAIHEFKSILSVKVNSECDPTLPPEDTIDCSAAAGAYYHDYRTSEIKFHTSLKKLELNFSRSLTPVPTVDSGYSLSVEGHVIYSGTFEDNSSFLELWLPQEGDYVLTFWAECIAEANVSSHCEGSKKDRQDFAKSASLRAALFD